MHMTLTYCCLHRDITLLRLTSQWAWTIAFGHLLECMILIVSLPIEGRKFKTLKRMFHSAVEFTSALVSHLMPHILFIPTLVLRYCGCECCFWSYAIIGRYIAVYMTKMFICLWMSMFESHIVGVIPPFDFERATLGMRKSSVLVQFHQNR